MSCCTHVAVHCTHMKFSVWKYYLGHLVAKYGSVCLGKVFRDAVITGSCIITYNCNDVYNQESGRDTCLCEQTERKCTKVLFMLYQETIVSKKDSETRKTESPPGCFRLRK